MLGERYDITKLLGKGRTGGVYEAEDTKLGRKVAMRRFFALNNSTDISGHVEEFKAVAQSLGGLQHPNLLSVLDAGVDDDGAYIVSQIEKGETLHEKLKNDSLPVSEVYDLAQVMADPAILAPELFDNSQATERADLYMLGHILYMSLAGGHPFAGLSFEEAEKLHLRGLPPIEEFNDEVPESFSLWIKSLTQINPDDRPSSALVAFNKLAPLQTPTNENIVVSVAEGVSNQLMPEKSSSKKGLLIGVGCVVAVVITIVAFMLMRDGENELPIVVDAVDEVSLKKEKGTKSIITEFDGSRETHRGWKRILLNPQRQRLDKDAKGWMIENRASEDFNGIKLPLRKRSDAMFIRGCKITYVMRPLEGASKLGFQLHNSLNPGWNGDKVGLYLFIERQDGEVSVSARNAGHRLKNEKLKVVPYAGDESWHTIVVELQPEDESGTYSVTIDGELAFEDTLSTGMSYGRAWNNSLFSSAANKKKKSKWLIKSLKLETVKDD